MFRKTPLANAVGLAVISSALGVSPRLLAQESEDEELREGTIEEIVITGSRIKKDVYSSSAPIDVVLTETAQLSGIADIGENRIQEFMAKQPEVSQPCRWHLIGTLQSNKATKAIGQFEMIHSIDRLKIAEVLSRLGTKNGVSTRILIEVNTTEETTKHGFAPDASVG